MNQICIPFGAELIPGVSPDAPYELALTGPSDILLTFIKSLGPIHAQLIALSDYSKFWNAIKGEDRDDIAEILVNKWTLSMTPELLKSGGLRMWSRPKLTEEDYAEEDD